MYYLYPLLIVVAGFGVAWLLSHRAVALLGRYVNPYVGVGWLVVIALVVGVPLVVWRGSVGVIFIGLAYCIVTAVGMARTKRLDLPPAVYRYFIAAMAARALGVAIYASIYVSRLPAAV